MSLEFRSRFSSQGEVNALKQDPGEVSVPIALLPPYVSRSQRRIQKVVARLVARGRETRRPHEPEEELNCSAYGVVRGGNPPDFQ